MFIKLKWTCYLLSSNANKQAKHPNLQKIVMAETVTLRENKMYSI